MFSSGFAKTPPLSLACDSRLYFHFCNVLLPHLSTLCVRFLRLLHFRKGFWDFMVSAIFREFLRSDFVFSGFRFSLSSLLAARLVFHVLGCLHCTLHHGLKGAHHLFLEEGRIITSMLCVSNAVQAQNLKTCFPVPLP